MARMMKSEGRTTKTGSAAYKKEMTNAHDRQGSGERIEFEKAQIEDVKERLKGRKSRLKEAESRSSMAPKKKIKIRKKAK